MDRSSVFRRWWCGFQFDEIPFICTFASVYKAQSLNGDLCCIFCRWKVMMPAEAAVAFPSSWLSLWHGFYSWFPRLSALSVWQRNARQSDLLHGSPTCRCWCRTTSCLSYSYLCSAVVDVQLVMGPSASSPYNRSLGMQQGSILLMWPSQRRCFSLSMADMLLMPAHSRTSRVRYFVLPLDA